MGKRLYLVAFDFLQPGDYGSLKIRLTAMHAQQLLTSVWALLASEPPDEIKQALRGFIDSQDRVLVVEVGRDWASRHAMFNLGEMLEPQGGPARVLWRRKWQVE